MLTGTLVNSAAIIAGGLIGLAVRRAGKDMAAAEPIVDGVMKALGLSVVVLGGKMIAVEHEYLSVVVCLCAGTFIGELLKIESQIERFGAFLRRLVKSKSTTFVEGFVSASVLFCIGAAAIVGALRDGLSSDPSLLYVKSLLDGICSLIFASTLGVGVLFAAIPIFIYQGGISLFASQLTFLTDNPQYLNGISQVGGIIVMGIGVNLMKVAKLRIGNTLPSLFIIPIYDAIVINFF
jgi:uncharacterized membrane protein YqgA involved in biofilm formation